MLYRTYRTVVTISHKLSLSEMVKDKSCLDMHTHNDVILVFKLPVKGWLDFKEIKAKIEAILDKEFRGVIGEMDTETYVFKLAHKVANGFAIDVESIFVSMQETAKYGVEYVGEKYGKL